MTEYFPNSKYFEKSVEVELVYVIMQKKIKINK